MFNGMELAEDGDKWRALVYLGFSTLHYWLFIQVIYAHMK